MTTSLKIITIIFICHLFEAANNIISMIINITVFTIITICRCCLSSGAYRYEVVGAMASVFLIWILTAALVYRTWLSVQNITHRIEYLVAELLAQATCAISFLHLGHLCMLARHICKNNLIYRSI